MRCGGRCSTRITAVRCFRNGCWCFGAQTILQRFSPSWQPVQHRSAQRPVRKPLYRSSDKTVMAVTYGRGLFKGQFGRSAGTPDIAVTPPVSAMAPSALTKQPSGMWLLRIMARCWTFPAPLTSNNAADYSIKAAAAFYPGTQRYPHCNGDLQNRFRPASNPGGFAYCQQRSRYRHSGCCAERHGRNSTNYANPTSLGYGLIAVNQSSSKIVEIKITATSIWLLATAHLCTMLPILLVTAGGGRFTLALNATS